MGKEKNEGTLKTSREEELSRLALDILEDYTDFAASEGSGSSPRIAFFDRFAKLGVDVGDIGRDEVIRDIETYESLATKTPLEGWYDIYMGEAENLRKYL